MLLMVLEHGGKSVIHAAFTTIDELPNECAMPGKARVKYKLARKLAEQEGLSYFVEHGQKHDVTNEYSEAANSLEVPVSKITLCCDPLYTGQAFKKREQLKNSYAVRFMHCCSHLPGMMTLSMFRKILKRWFYGITGGERSSALLPPQPQMRCWSKVPTPWTSKDTWSSGWA